MSTNPKPRRQPPRKPSRLKRLWWGAREGFATIGSVILASPMIAALSVLTAGLIILFLLGLGAIAPHSRGTQIELSQALQRIAAKQVDSATIRNVDDILQLQMKDGTLQYASFPSSGAYTPQILDTLTKTKTPYGIDPQAGKPTIRAIVQFLLPILILVSAFSIATLAARSGGGGFALFSKFAGGSARAGTGQITFKDVAGAPEALIELEEICDYLENPARYAALGARAPKGVLLTGPPGTGKTLLARAVAGEADANFFSLSGSEFVESLVGVGAARVRDLFKQARKAAPAIIFIDEIDAAGRQRGAGVGQGNDEREQTLNQLLVELDGFGAGSGIVVMAATNRPDILDSALLRPGRFDRQVVVDLPDAEGREQILALYARKAPIAPDVDLRRIASQTPGFSGAELANVINEAALLAVRANKPKVEQPELEEAIDRVVSGPERRSHVLSHDERWRIAIHEAGHAIVARAVGNVTAAQKLSIVARGRGTGGTTVYASSDKLLLSHLDLMRSLITTLGGAAAELSTFGMLSTGVEDDLHDATGIARSMVAHYGMSQAIGLMAVGEKQGEVFIGRDLANMGNVAPETLQLVDAELRIVLQDVERTAQRIVDQNVNLLGELGRALVEHETLSGPALEVYLGGTRRWDEPLVPVRPLNGLEMPQML